MIKDTFEIYMNVDDPVLKRVMFQFEGVTRQQALKLADGIGKLTNFKCELAYILKGHREV